MNWQALLSSPVVAVVAVGLMGFGWKLLLPLFDKGEAAADAEIEGADFFKKHPGYKNALEFVIHRANIVVKSVGQTLVDSLKASGKFDSSAAATAKAAALGSLKATMSRESLEQLAVEMGMNADQAHQTDAVLGHIIESVIADRKSGSTLSATAVDAVSAAVKASLEAGGSMGVTEIAAAAAQGEIAGVKAGVAAGASPEAGAAAAV